MSAGCGLAVLLAFQDRSSVAGSTSHRLGASAFLVAGAITVLAAVLLLRPSVVERCSAPICDGLARAAGRDATQGQAWSSVRKPAPRARSQGARLQSRRRGFGARRSRAV